MFLCSFLCAKCFNTIPGVILKGKSLGWAQLLSHLTDRQTNVLLSQSSKPTFCAVLCNAGVWTLQTSFFFASRLQLLPPVGAPEEDGKAGGGERRLPASDVCDVPSGADHLNHQQVVPAFSIFRLSHTRPHWVLEIPASMGSASASRVRALVSYGSSGLICWASVF